MLTAEAIIQHLQLEALAEEGCYFRRTVESSCRIANAQLGAPYPAAGDRPLGTVIYVLITRDGFSAMHRVPTPETWFYHLGDPLEILVLHPGGKGETVVLGPELTAGQSVQYTVPAHSWQGTRLPANPQFGYTLCSAALSPGFEWSDFELGDFTSLASQYPEWAHAIRPRVRACPSAGRR